MSLDPSESMDCRLPGGNLKKEVEQKGDVGRGRMLTVEIVE